MARPRTTSAQSFTSESRLFQSVSGLATRAGHTDSRHGVVVRWALPDALTAGGAADEQTGTVTFPPVPNRWLVARCPAARAPPRPGCWRATTSAATVRRSTPRRRPSWAELDTGRLAGGGGAARRARAAADRPGTRRSHLRRLPVERPACFRLLRPAHRRNPGKGELLGRRLVRRQGHRPELGGGWLTRTDWPALMGRLGWSGGTTRPPSHRRPGRGRPGGRPRVHHGPREPAHVPAVENVCHGLACR